jgi:hypothetical protein
MGSQPENAGGCGGLRSCLKSLCCFCCSPAQPYLKNEESLFTSKERPTIITSSPLAAIPPGSITLAELYSSDLNQGALAHINHLTIYERFASGYPLNKLDFFDELPGQVLSANRKFILLEPKMGEEVGAECRRLFARLAELCPHMQSFTICMINGCSAEELVPLLLAWSQSLVQLKVLISGLEFRVLFKMLSTEVSSVNFHSHSN